MRSLQFTGEELDLKNKILNTKNCSSLLLIPGVLSWPIDMCLKQMPFWPVGDMVISPNFPFSKI